MEAAVKVLKTGKSAGEVIIQAEIVKAEGDTMAMIEFIQGLENKRMANRMDEIPSTSNHYQRRYTCRYVKKRHNRAPRRK